MDNPFCLEGKKILITGASSGIGKSIAIECSRQGAEVIVIGRNKSNIDLTFSQLPNVEVENSYFYADLTKNEDREKLVDNIPILDGIVHCAGISEPKPFRFTSDDDLKKVLDINFIAPVSLTNGILKAKKIKNNASIIFISSMVGNKISFFGSSLYGGSKSAINGFAKGLALELAGKKVRVNSILPGMIKTDLLINSNISKDQFLEDEKKYPLKRYGKPEDVAYATIFLLSDASCWITGHELLIDGGFTLN